MLHKHGPFKKFLNEYYEISVFKQPYLKSGTLAKKGPYVREMTSSRKIVSLFNVILNNDDLILIGQHTGNLFVIYDGLITDSHLDSL